MELPSAFWNDLKACSTIFERSCAGRPALFFQDDGSTSPSTSFAFLLPLVGVKVSLRGLWALCTFAFAFVLGAAGAGFACLALLGAGLSASWEKQLQRTSLIFLRTVIAFLLRLLLVILLLVLRTSICLLTPRHEFRTPSTQHLLADAMEQILPQRLLNVVATFVRREACIWP